MTIRESLRNKKIAADQIGYRVNAWYIYDEQAVLLFYKNFEMTVDNLDKLLDYLSLVDKLILVLPKGTSNEVIFKCENLQSVDLITMVDEIDEVIDASPYAKLAFEGMEYPKELTAEQKKRLISL